MSREFSIGARVISLLRQLRTTGAWVLAGLLAAASRFTGCTGAPSSTEASPATPSLNGHAAGRPVVQTAAADAQADSQFPLGCRAEVAQDMERAIGEYLTALRADPSSLHLKTRLARLYVVDGESAPMSLLPMGG